MSATGRMAAISNSLVVRVPVLSKHTTEALARPSIAASFCTATPFRAMRMMPVTSVMVEKKTSPSGIIPSTSVATRRIESTLVNAPLPSRARSAVARKMAMTKLPVKRALTRRWRGEGRRSTRRERSSIWAAWVSTPVATTRITRLPATQDVPAYTLSLMVMCCGSDSPVSSEVSSSAP